MPFFGLPGKRWSVPVAVAIVGVILSLLSYTMAERAEDERVRSILEFRADWRTRDLEAKVRLTAAPVENVAIAITAAPMMAEETFLQVATHARRGLQHINALQWAPRVPKGQIKAFEMSARMRGFPDYQVFDITPDFKRVSLFDRAEYYPILFETRFNDKLDTHGLAIGRFEDRRIPMERARDAGTLSATPPVRPIVPTGSKLVYLVYWPVYDTLDVPETVEARRAGLRGFVSGNYDLVAMLNAAMQDTPPMNESLQFTVGLEHAADPAAQAVAYYSPATGKVEVGLPTEDVENPVVVRLQRDFAVFDQHWDLTFDFSARAIAGMRSNGAWGWLFGGLVLTGWLVFYLVRETLRRHEIEQIVEARTAELKQTSEQLHQAQKMEAIGNMTGGMAHDFNNLLAVVIGNLDLLLERLGGDPDSKTLVEGALQASERGAELTGQLLAFARRQALAPKVVAIDGHVVGMTRLLERILAENILVKVITGPATWPVTIDPAQLSAAIANLANNARDAMPEGGTLTIETKNTHLDADYAALNPEVIPGDYVLLEVSDTGIGMSQETLAQAFEPFFTTKEVGRGTGLGLSMVFGFVKQSQGHVKIYSELGHGTVVRLYLPRAEKAVANGTHAERPAAEPPRNETVLVVEDNEGVRAVVSRQLRELGYKVVEADGPRRALDLLKNPDLAVDVLFTDLVMPGMNGVELAEEVAKLRAGLPILFTSGYSGSSLMNDERLRQDGRFLSKPYRKQDLARMLRELLDRGAGA
jgi:signal transduction histidine kinase